MLDNIIFKFLNSFALKNFSLDIFLIFCAEHLVILLVIIFVIYYLKKFFYPRLEEKFTSISVNAFQIIIFILISAFLVYFVGEIINYFYFSPRPFLVLNNVNLLFSHGGNESFPSGHTVFIFALAFLNYFYGSRKLNLFLFSGAFLVSLSRVIVGVHWPVDILGGIVISFLGVLAIKRVVPDIKNNKFLK